MNYFLSLLQSNAFADTVVIAILGGLLFKLIAYLYKLLSEYFYSYSNFTLSGIWISKFDSYALDKGNIEIVHIKQKKESIILNIQQYNTTNLKIFNYKGTGVFRGAELSAIYYPINKTFIQNGTILMRVFHSVEDEPKLIGFYQEFDNTTNDKKVKLGGGDYALQRINISLVKKLKLLFHLNCFKTYQEITSEIRRQKTAEQ